MGRRTGRNKERQPGTHADTQAHARTQTQRGATAAVAEFMTSCTPYTQKHTHTQKKKTHTQKHKYKKDNEMVNFRSQKNKRSALVVLVVSSKKRKGVSEAWMLEARCIRIAPQGR